MTRPILIMMCLAVVSACGVADVSTHSELTTDSRLKDSNPIGATGGGSGGGGETTSTEQFIEGGGGSGGSAGACTDGGTVTQIFEYVAATQTFDKTNRIGTGPGGPPMSVQTGCTPCAAGEVEVLDQTASDQNKDRSGMTADGSPTDYAAPQCVTAPPTCASGTFPEWVPPTPEMINGVMTGNTIAAHWACTGPCDLLVSYGGLFGNRVVCAPQPTSTMCSSGETLTFDLNSETWQCQTSCQGGTYDPATLSGVGVCVPC